MIIYNNNMTLLEDVRTFYLFIYLFFASLRNRFQSLIVLYFEIANEPS